MPLRELVPPSLLKRASRIKARKRPQIPENDPGFLWQQEIDSSSGFQPVDRGSPDTNDISVEKMDRVLSVNELG